MKKNELKKYPLLNFHKDLVSICQPLFQQAGYNIMNFIRLYDDGRIFYLCDNYEWLKLYLLNSYPSIGAFEQIIEFRNKEYVLWDALNDSDPIVIYSRKMFNIKMGITLIRKFAGGYDFFNFGTPHNERAHMDNLAQQVDKLNHFSLMFYDKARRLINSASQHCLNLRDFGRKAQTPTREEMLKLEPKFYLGPNYDYSYLTAKEILYLKDLAQGLTVPKVAELRAISPRTIEKHLEHIKEKLHCKTQYELGYLTAKLGLDSL